MSTATPTCCICGAVIDATDKESPDALSMDHVPPKQFYPKSIRVEGNLNLWSTPTHKRCNCDYKKDEEYFYHSLYPLVANVNQKMGQTIFKDIKRRAQKPQSRTMIRGLLKTARTETEGGIQLPAGIFQMRVNEYRIQRIAIKIAQGVFFLEHDHYLPRGNCKDMRICESEQEVPEMYSLSWGLAEMATVYPSVFSYRRAFLDGMWFYSLLFWEAFMFCMVFDCPLSPGTSCEGI